MPVAAAVPIAAATVGSSALNVAGGLFSNKTNKKIARETNALNYQMFQEANEYNERMWNAANVYNSPLNQRRLLEEAGYNPASLIDAPQIGNASAHPGSVTPPPMQGWNYQNVLQNVGADLVASTQALKNLNEAKGQDLQNKNYEWKLTEEIDLMRKQGLLSQANAEKLSQEVDLNTATWDDLMKQIHANAYLTQKNADIANLQHDILTSYGHVKAEAELDKICAEAYAGIQDGNYKKAASALSKAEIGYKQAMVIIEQARQRQEARESESRIGVNQAQRANIISSTSRQNMENEVYKEFGRGKEATNIMEAYQRWQNLITDGKIKSWQEAVDHMEAELKTLPPMQKARAFNIWMDNIIPFWNASPYSIVPSAVK